MNTSWAISDLCRAIQERAAAPAAPLPQEPHLTPVEKSALDTTTDKGLVSTTH